MHRESYFGGWQRRKKYGNVRTEVKGVHYDSKFESKVGFDLDCRKRAGDIKDYQRQVTFDLVVNGIRISGYRADFVVEHLDGSKEIVEAKGFMTQVGLMKLRLVEALFCPPYKLTIVRQ